MRTIILLVLALISFQCFSQQPAQYYFNLANEALAKKDYEEYSIQIRKANERRPNHPIIVAKVAEAWALTGRRTRAVQTIRQMLLMDATYDFEGNTIFDDIRNHRDYGELLELQRTLGTKEVHDESYLTINAAELHPESFVLLEDGGLLLGSIRKKKIVKVSPEGLVTDWLDLPFAVLGMKPDYEKNHIWVSTAAVPQMEGFEPEDQGKSIVFQIDINSGRIIQGIEFDETSIIGDIVLDSLSRLWLSNSLEPYLTRTNTDTAEYLGSFSRLQYDMVDTQFNLQGLTLTENQEHLYFADYISGIHRINFVEDKIEKIFAPETSLLKGIDGLYFYNNTLIAIHNGTKPYKVVQYFLYDTGLTIELERVINRGGESLGEPTLGQVKDGYFYYLANSPWPAYDEEKNLNVEGWGPIEIRRIKLD